MEEKTPRIFKENVLLIENSELLGMVKRDEKTGRPMLYTTEPMDMEIVERMFKHLLRGETNKYADRNLST